MNYIDTLKKIDAIEMGGAHIWCVPVERIVKETEKALGIVLRNNEFRKAQAGERAQLEWIPKSQVQGWYTGKDGRCTEGLYVSFQFGSQNSGIKYMKYAENEIVI